MITTRLRAAKYNKKSAKLLFLPLGEDLEVLIDASFSRKAELGAQDSESIEANQ